MLSEIGIVGHVTKGLAKKKKVEEGKKSDSLVRAVLQSFLY
jgi:hypothetical protein